MVLPVSETFSTDSGLNQYIQAIDQNGQSGTTYTIKIDAPFTLTSDIEAVNLPSGVSLVIEGTDGAGDPAPQALSGGGAYSGFFVYSGSVTIENLTVQDAVAKGGDGASGGGGGAGLGGGLFVGAQAQVTLDNVSFSGDAARGGDGAAGSDGGGGGLNGGAGGNGGGYAYTYAGVSYAIENGGGGGGIGQSAVGGKGATTTSPGGTGGNGIVGHAGPAQGGASGGAGGQSGGGGGGGGEYALGNDGGDGGHGGINGSFGGGGGGGWLYAAHTTDSHSGGTIGVGGSKGGFGGGGGGGNVSDGGGAGGFGGGGGAGSAAGKGGFGGASAGPSGGGGGLGAGGDIFVQVGGTLTIEGGSLSGGSVEGGDGAGGAGTGSDFGSGIFYGGTGSGTGAIIFEPQAADTAANPQLVSDNIADDLGSGGTGAQALTLQVVVDGPGTLELSGENSYRGGTLLESGTLVLSGNEAAGSGPIVFAPIGDPTLAFTTGSLPANPLGAFTAVGMDHIDITDLPFADISGHSVSAGPTPGEDTLVIDLKTGGPIDLHFSTTTGASYSTGSFLFAADTSGNGTEIDPACFLEGTLIATERGEVAVEALAIGDRVVTKDGSAKPIKWIGRRVYDGRFAAGDSRVMPICIKADALADGVPRRDLWLSPQHALYLDGMLIPAGALVNGASIVQARAMARIAYYHIELAAHDVLLAEGAPAESFVDDDSRTIFQNAHEYRALYPGAVRNPARYCAPRVEEGYELAAMRYRLALRAGLASATESARLGALCGSLDLIGATLIEGWAQNEAQPEAPVCLEILVAGKPIAQVIANRYRRDLREVGVGSGCHAFTFTPPPGLALAPETVTVRRALDGALLPAGRALQERAA
jgi:hypothetical protein